VYSRNISGKEFSFGVSGLLYKSNVLMYDHQTESLWSQVKGEAVTGVMTETPLRVLPSTLTTWSTWKKRFPETEVLSPETGYTRNYSRDPYEDYYKKKKGFFSFFKPGPGEEEKRLIAGVILKGISKAYPLDILRKKKMIKDRLGAHDIKLTFNPETDVLTIHDQDGNEIPYMVSYWFVWKGIHPTTKMFKTKK
jgi:hypothetical protein